MMIQVGANIIGMPEYITLEVPSKVNTFTVREKVLKPRSVVKTIVRTASRNRNSKLS